MEEVDLAGLKKETARQILRAFKKAGKAEERLRKLLERDAAGPASSDANAAKNSQETSQADGDGAVEELVALETERDALQERLLTLNDLEALLQVCVCVRERERARARASESQRERERACMHACVRLAPREGGAPTRPRVTLRV